ncbi:PAS domain-containing protein [Aquibium microcysteis]|uniref:PAS domain-containing protein n=1 Tax=Aquibium microcysteis TaxID=675281 RepID=UPI00165D0D13|nr:PAS domain-containing protein [Aquibium microcysteis]
MSGQDILHTAFGKADPDSLARMIASVADVAVVLDRQDRVRDASWGGRSGGFAADVASWTGRSLPDLVAAESVDDLQDLLAAARAGGNGLPRTIRHPTPSGHVSVEYAAMAFGGEGEIVLIGTSAPPVPRPQSSSESLFHRLWAIGSEAMLLVDGRTGAIRDGNRAAAVLLGIQAEAVRSGRLADHIEGNSRAEVSVRLRGVLSSGRPDRFQTPLRGDRGGRLSLVAEPAAGGEAGLLLVRLSQAGERDAGEDPSSSLPQLIRESPDPVVLIDPAGSILWANDSFLAAVGAPAEVLAIGRGIDEFVTVDGGRRLADLLSAAERQGRLLAGGLGLEALDHGTTPCEAVIFHAPDPVLPRFGIVLRVLRAGAGSAPSDGDRLDLTALTDLVGRTPLRDLVQNTTDLIEKMCVEAALRLTGDNRSAAARALGLSRQAFYLKLRRFGLAGTADD